MERDSSERNYRAAITDFQKRRRGQWLLCVPLLLVALAGVVFYILYGVTNLIDQQVALGIVIGLVVALVAAGIPAAYGQMAVHEWRCPRCDKSPWERSWAKPIRVYLFAAHQQSCPNCGLSFTVTDEQPPDQAMTPDSATGEAQGRGTGR
jgi:hypothetical protein